MATKTGATRGSGKDRRKWNGRRWVPAPVRTTPAQSTRRGAGRTRSENRRSSGSSSSRTLPTRAPGQQNDMARGVVQGDQSVKTKAQREAEAAKKRAAAVRARAKAKADAAKKDGTKKAPTAPTLPPKPRASSSSKPAASKPRPSNTAKPTQAAKPPRRTSTTQGPTKSGSFYQSKGSSTKGGPTKSGSTYKRLGNNAKGRTKRLTSALSNLKVRSYNKKKK